MKALNLNVRFLLLILLGVAVVLVVVTIVQENVLGAEIFANDSIRGTFS